MKLKTDLIHLSPDDDPETFFKKLGYISESKIVEEVERFKKYEWYMKLIKFHLLTLREPERNVQLTYNGTYGWHVTSCIRSFPEEEKIINLSTCTCETEIENPKAFFDKLKYDMIFRCKVCMRYFPEWEEDAGIKFHEDRLNGTENDENDESRAEKIKLESCKCQREQETVN